MEAGDKEEEELGAETGARIWVHGLQSEAETQTIPPWIWLGILSATVRTLVLVLLLMRCLIKHIVAVTFCGPDKIN